MLFTSYEFVIFILACFLLYYIVPKKFQWMILLAASYFFYFMAGTFFPLFIFITSFSTYLAGRVLNKLSDEQQNYIAQRKAELTKEEKKAYKSKMNAKSKGVMLACLLFNFGILAVLKYTNFAIDNINNLFMAVGSAKEISFVDIIIPLGISFYTFQSMGYLLDVYWGKSRAQSNFFKFALFVSFFPQLVQGPISRYNDLKDSLYKEHTADWIQIRRGLERILWGYFKKMVIADRILVAVNMIIDDPDYYRGGFVLIGMVFYAIELYADFTGGIDITIGIAQVFGIRLAENFERPFFSKNIAEYWRRWHITMGTWFKDYVFYPMSISKPLKNATTFSKKHFGKGVARRVPIYIATLVTWFATGIWHGASWNFIVWGLLNGIIILISQECEPLYARFHQKFPSLSEKRYYQGFQVIRTFLLMCSLRLLDCYRDVGTSAKMFLSMFTEFRITDLTAAEFLDMGLTGADYFIVLAGVLIMIIVSLKGRRGSVREAIDVKPFIIWYALIIGLFFAVILFGAYGIGYDAAQFIYNQF